MAGNHARFPIFLGALFAQMVSSTFTCLIGIFFKKINKLLYVFLGYVLPFVVFKGEIILFYVTNIIFVVLGLQMMKKSHKKLKVSLFKFVEQIFFQD